MSSSASSSPSSLRWRLEGVLFLAATLFPSRSALLCRQFFLTVNLLHRAVVRLLQNRSGNDLRVRLNRPSSCEAELSSLWFGCARFDFLARAGERYGPPLGTAGHTAASVAGQINYAISGCRAGRSLALERGLQGGSLRPRKVTPRRYRLGEEKCVWQRRRVIMIGKERKLAAFHCAVHPAGEGAIRPGRNTFAVWLRNKLLRVCANRCITLRCI